MKKEHLNMSYPPIYIINLKRTPERKLYMQRQLDALNLNYRFIEAIDKYDLVSKTYRATIARQLDIPESQMESLYEDHAKSRISTDKELRLARGLGVLGCLLSHVKVYNIISIIVRYLSLKVSIKPFNIGIKAPFGAYRKVIYEIGGIPIPDKSTWYRTVSNHYICMPYQHRSNRILTTTAYMLTKSAAIQWKKKLFLHEKEGQ